MEIIAYASIAYLAVRIMVSLVNLTTKTELKHAVPERGPKVSILIPARNEEVNIGKLLSDLAGLNYDNFEVLVYDDQSTDATASVIQETAGIDSRFRYIQGRELPEGWLGKNHACHQLALNATGDYLLFLDADVRCGKELLDDVISVMQKEKTALLSIFPVQEMISIGEWLTVPLMNRILLGNLPLALVRKSELSSFSAANGQFMMFDAEVYRQNHFHEIFRMERVEDIRIIRHMKKQGYHVMTLVSNGAVKCRMYGGFREAINGFSKNIHAFFGSNWLALFLYVILTSLGPVSVWYTFNQAALYAYILAVVLFATLVSYQSKQNLFRNISLLPFQQVTVIIISLFATYRHFTRQHYWKGRKI